MGHRKAYGDLRGPEGPVETRKDSGDKMTWWTKRACGASKVFWHPKGPVPQRGFGTPKGLSGPVGHLKG